MKASIAKTVVCVLALTLAVPESYARRLGGGRSVGRQSQAMRQRPAPMPMQRQPVAPAPVPAPMPMQRPSPDLARQSLPPAAMPRQSGTPWGGMLGGALVGLGLGSMLGHRNNDNNNNGQASGGNADGSTVSGTGTATDGTAGPGAVQPAQRQGSSFGSFLIWGLLALGAFMLFRRFRRGNRQSRS